MSENKQQHKERAPRAVERREALKRFGAVAAGTAPAVMVLLSSRNSAAGGFFTSGGNNEGGGGAAFS